MVDCIEFCTKNCVISFLDLYEKVKKNAPNLKPPIMEEQIELSKAFVKIGKENDMTNLFLL